VERFVLEMNEHVEIDDKVNDQYVHHCMSMIYDSYLNIQEKNFFFGCKLIYLPGD